MLPATGIRDRWCEEFGHTLLDEDTMGESDRITETILALVHQRGGDASICPSEVARALEPADWRPLMPSVREAARRLAAAGRVELRQRGEVVDPHSNIRGPLRIASGSLGRDTDVNGGHDRK